MINEEIITIYHFYLQYKTRHTWRAKTWEISDVVPDTIPHILDWQNLSTVDLLSIVTKVIFIADNSFTLETLS